MPARTAGILPIRNGDVHRGTKRSARPPDRGALHLSVLEVGDTIVPGQTLCVLEAMKLFNELKAEIPGTLRAIHVENAQAVEYGQLLFEIDPLSAPPAV